MEEEFTDEKAAECKEIFDLFDSNKDGEIDYEEFCKAMRAIGTYSTPSELTSMYNGIKDDKGNIKFHLFLDNLERNWADLKNNPTKTFIEYDNEVNGKETGKISIEDFKKIANLGDDKITDKELEDIIRDLSHGNDSISYRELINYMKP